ncbi:MAG: 23S rRNA (pseudouridine(1915)-N(3))-methyltransferase RlmH [Firmicutes bacterium]|nr:23S rRNA (pseudouridine(1915)-N(3))-methyltransferase RlmH [Bacillota bacterium]
MKVKILAVGKIKEPFWKDAIAEYTKRLSGYITLEIIEVDEAKIPQGASEKEEAIAKEKESQNLLAKIKSGEYVVALDLNAPEFDSLAFAAHLEKLFVKGDSLITFVIGGSLGLGPEIKKRANERLSLSALTFTHPMTRIILLEQIYRAFKINRGETYHK